MTNSVWFPLKVEEIERKRIGLKFTFLKLILTKSLVFIFLLTGLLALQWQRIGDVSQEIKRVRAQMEENEQLSILMKGLRGQNLRDSQFAADNVQLRLVEVCIHASYRLYDVRIPFL